MTKRIRITVVGDGDTGKTCMLIVYKDRKYEEFYIPTVFDSYSMNIPVNDQEYVVILSDTAGQEEYDRLRTLSYPETDVFIVCYSVNNRDSYENVITKWHPELKHFKSSARIILVGTKSDLRTGNESTAIKRSDGERLCKYIKAEKYIECSSKYMYNIDKVFHEAVLSHVGKNLASKKSDKKSICVCL